MTFGIHHTEAVHIRDSQAESGIENLSDGDASEGEPDSIGSSRQGRSVGGVEIVPHGRHFGTNICGIDAGICRFRKNAAGAVGRALLAWQCRIVRATGTGILDAVPRTGGAVAVPIRARFGARNGAACAKRRGPSPIGQ